MKQDRKYWVFDLDGTMIDSFSAYLSFVRAKLAVSGRALSAELAMQCVGLPAHKFFNAHFEPEEARLIVEELRLRSAAAALEHSLFPGITSLLQELKARGSKIAVWTSRDLASAKVVLENTGIAEFIEICVSGCCVENHKPDIEGLQKIADAFSCHTSDLVVVGDHDFDMKAARSAGAYAIRACWHGFDAPSRCEFADEIARSVEEISARHSHANLSFPAR